MYDDNYNDEQQWRDVQAACDGDRQALGRLYDQLFPRLYGYVAQRAPTQQDAEDIVAEVWLKAVRKLSQFRGQHPGAFRGWLFQIARRELADHYRYAPPTQATADEELMQWPAEGPLPAHLFAREEQQQRIRALIRTLSPRRQEVITLRYFGGLRNKEIADLLALDERTVASHLSRALAQLHERLSKEIEDG